MDCPHCVAVTATGGEHCGLHFEKPDPWAIEGAGLLPGHSLPELAQRQQSESRWGLFPDIRAWRAKLTSVS